ncbi:sugar kinase [Sulfitobacter sp. SK012]|uniref:ROK family protein n=1 Tax=Sulfitobacter sp. SK012 TaxID=1389005 RepID=UPI000E0B1293|nr:ROK family transcriptional regulator [Sulfitobacter sp. SK012]AXI47799.1 sugar kinase [Sulfitobacter sp. SK012]
MDGSNPVTGRRGVNQSGVRDHNERLLLSMLRRLGPTPGSDLARLSGLSPQTVSIILRKLEKDAILKRGDPIRGKVGKPSIPMHLNPNGVLSLGLRVGRRSADLLLLDFTGAVRKQAHIAYQHPVPDEIFSFLENGITEFLADLSEDARARICGIGIAMPFELWKWHSDGPETEPMKHWEGIDFPQVVAQFSELPVFVDNDATAACQAEHLHGRGSDFRDYAYFFIGSFIGGGVVLNGTVFEGHQGNAGALGALRSTGPSGESRQLVDVASLHLLESRLNDAGIDPGILWQTPQDWSSIMRYADPWIGETAQELAKASLSICSVIDFEAILIDGSFPSEIREALVERVRRYLVTQDTRGLITPRIEAGAIGPNARGLGAASSPIVAQFMLDTNSGLGRG